MRPPAAIRVHNNLTASDTRIPLQRERKKQRGEMRPVPPDGWQGRAAEHCDGRWKTYPGAARGHVSKVPWLEVSQKSWLDPWFSH